MVIGRCCPWAPDPIAFGPCPHCTGPHAVGRTATEELHRGWFRTQAAALADFTRGAGT